MAGLTQPLEFRRFMRSGPLPGFDVVPFLDAILIALFISLNASVFVLAPGTAVQLPVSDSLEATRAAPTAVLTVDRNELYFFEGRKLARVTLERQLREFVENHRDGDGPGPVLLLKADSSITSATLFTLMDTARKVGFAEVQLAAEIEAIPGDSTQGAVPAPLP